MIAAGPYLFHNENEKCNKLRNAFGGGGVLGGWADKSH